MSWTSNQAAVWTLLPDQRHRCTDSTIISMLSDVRTGKHRPSRWHHSIERHLSSAHRRCCQVSAASALWVRRYQCSLNNTQYTVIVVVVIVSPSHFFSLSLVCFPDVIFCCLDHVIICHVGSCGSICYLPWYAGDIMLPFAESAMRE